MATGRLATLPGAPPCAALTLLRSPTSHRMLRLVVALLAVMTIAAAASGTAMAKQKTCAEQVIADWFDDGRVDKIYPLECYPKAIKSLPPDLLIYGSAEEEIGRAWDFAKLGKPDPGGKDPTPPASGDPTQTGTSTDPNQTGTSTDPNQTDPTSTDTTTDTSGPSAVPIPVLVLGGLAVLLLAAGSAGYLRRRMNGDGDGDGTPPAAA
jgi:hypothetical protein